MKPNKEGGDTLMSGYDEYCDDYVYRKSDLKYFYIELQQQRQKQEQFQAQLQLQQQKQEQLQAQAQNDTDNTSFSNIGNPTVNVHVNSTDDDKGKGSKQTSAFRATKGTETQIPFAGTVYNVSFESIDFDLNGEYDTNTSTFVAKNEGVYLFTATLDFTPSANVKFQFGVVLNVDGVPVNYDKEFTGVDAINDATVDLSQIVKLKAGQTVSIGAFSTVSGVVPICLANVFAGAKIA